MRHPPIPITGGLASFRRPERMAAFHPTSAVRSCYARLKLETHLPHHNPVLKVKFRCQITLPKHSEIGIAEK